jgi:hypothetical protein
MCANMASGSDLQQVTYREPVNKTDHYEIYILELLKLSLNKTLASHGPYELQPLPQSINRLRAKRAILNDEFPGLVIEDSYENSLVANGDIVFLPFPVDLGVLSYRVCFVSPKVASQVAAASFNELKKYKILQGIGWADSKILRANGFKVEEVGSYHGYFRVVASGRADLFCVGANQVMKEYFSNADITKLIVNDSFYFYYPLPRFFYLNKQNKQLRERIYAGLLLAYKDGSLQALWRKRFTPSLEFVAMGARQAFVLHNPLLSNLDKDYERYLIAPNTIMGASLGQSAVVDPVKE